MSHWQIQEFDGSHPDWSEFIAHLYRVNKEWANLAEENKNNPDIFYFGLVRDDGVVGHITVRKQPMVVPASNTNGHKETHLVDRDDNALYELYVLAFAVEDAHRRQGYGNALQELALQKAYDLDCYQMRSWSLADKTANYALKIGMGFTVHPTVFPQPTGELISGVYFTKKIRD